MLQPCWGQVHFGVVTLLCLLLQEKVKAVFDNLIQLEHLNIVKFHKYWADVKENKARVSGVLPAHPPRISFPTLLGF